MSLEAFSGLAMMKVQTGTPTMHIDKFVRGKGKVFCYRVCTYNRKS